MRWPPVPAACLFFLVFALFDLGYMHFAPPEVSVLAALLFFFVILNHIRERGE